MHDNVMKQCRTEAPCKLCRAWRCIDLNQKHFPDASAFDVMPKD